MSYLLILVSCLLGQWLLGLAVVRLLFRGTDDTSARPAAVEQVGLGLVLGIGLNSWILFLWSWLGGSLEPFVSMALTGCGLVAGIAIFWITRRTPSQTTRVTSQSLAPETMAFCRLCQWGVGLLIVVAMSQSLMTPLRLWDERAHFSIKASVLFEDRTIRSADLADRDFVQGHPRYPLLIPLAQVHLYLLLGEVDDRLAKVYFPLLYAGLVLTMIGVLSRHLSAGRAWLWGMLLATIPALMPNDYGFLCGQADAPVGCYHGLAVLYLWDALERMRLGKPLSMGTIVVAGICGGLTAFTKDEGLAYLIIDGAILSTFALIPLGQAAWTPRATRPPAGALIGGNSRSLIIATAMYAACAAIIVVPWLIHRRGLPQTAEMNYAGRLSFAFLTSRLETLAWSVPHLARRMFWEWADWGLQWWLMAAALVAFPRRSLRLSQLLLLLDVLGALSALLVAGMLAPVQLEEHLGGSSHRFLMQIAPVAILFAAGQQRLYFN